jgi:hypothetical protein
MTAKMKGKPHRKETRSDWKDLRSTIMRWCLKVKLVQNYNTFGELLLSTGEKPIVEQSRKDQFWGAKLVGSGETLEGQNVMGNLLMELRELLKADSEGSLRTVHPLNIPDFLLLGKPIQAVRAEPIVRQNKERQPTLF